VSIFPLFYQGDVQWENHFRRHRNRQKLCSWILFPRSLQVKKKSGAKFSAVSCSCSLTCETAGFPAKIVLP
jgi:hypothetical protein